MSLSSGRRAVMATSFRVGAIAACLIAAAMTAGVVCIGATGKELKDDEKLTKLFEERAKLAEQAFDAYRVGYDAGTITLESLLASANELADAKIPLCKTK